METYKRNTKNSHVQYPNVRKPTPTHVQIVRKTNLQYRHGHVWFLNKSIWPTENKNSSHAFYGAAYQLPERRSTQRDITVFSLLHVSAVLLWNSWTVHRLSAQIQTKNRMLVLAVDWSLDKAEHSLFAGAAGFLNQSIILPRDLIFLAAKQNRDNGLRRYCPGTCFLLVKPLPFSLKQNRNCSAARFLCSCSDEIHLHFTCI